MFLSKSSVKLKVNDKEALILLFLPHLSEVTPTGNLQAICYKIAWLDDVNHQWIGNQKLELEIVHQWKVKLESALNTPSMVNRAGIVDPSHRRGRLPFLPARNIPSMESRAVESSSSSSLPALPARNIPSMESRAVESSSSGKSGCPWLWVGSRSHRLLTK